MAYIKPQTPFINWRNPLTRGLYFDMPFFEGAGPNSQDIAYKQNGVWSNAPLWRSSPSGPAMAMTANSTQVITSTLFSENTALSQVSVEALVYPTSVSANSAYIISKNSTTANVPTFALTFQGSGTIDFLAGWNGASGQWNTASSVYAANTWYHIIQTYSPSSASNNPTLFLNGVATTQAVVIAPSGSAVTDNTTLLVGNRESNNRAWGGYIAYVRMYNRLLSLQDARALYTNPFQIYSFPEVYRLNLIAGTPVTSKVSNANIQSLGNLANLQTI